MPQLPHQDRLVDQIIFDNQDMRFGTHRRDFLSGMTLLHRRSLVLGLDVTIWSRELLCLTRPSLNEESECGAFPLFRGDLYPTAHNIGDLYGTYQCHEPVRETSKPTSTDKQPETGTAEDSVRLGCMMIVAPFRLLRTHAKPVRTAGTAIQAPSASYQDQCR